MSKNSLPIFFLIPDKGGKTEEADKPEMSGLWKDQKVDIPSIDKDRVCSCQLRVIKIFSNF